MLVDEKERGTARDGVARAAETLFSAGVPLKRAVLLCVIHQGPEWALYGCHVRHVVAEVVDKAEEGL